MIQKVHQLSTLKIFFEMNIIKKVLGKIHFLKIVFNKRVYINIKLIKIKFSFKKFKNFQHSFI